MDIGFVIPSLTTQGSAAYLELPWPMQAAPVLSGFLRRHGVTGIRHYDFDNHVLSRWRSDPLSVDLSSFDDEAEVSRALAGEPSRPLVVANNLLEIIGIGPHRLFGISLASVVGMETEIRRGMHLAMCLATALKRRFGDSTTIVGGLQVAPQSRQRELYRAMLHRCPALDFAGEGDGRPLLLALVRALDTHQSLSRSVDGEVTLEPCARGGILSAAHPGKGTATHRLARDSGVESSESGLEADCREVSAPWFDPENLGAFSPDGRTIASRYGITEQVRAGCQSAHDERYLVLPARFVTGCSFGCAFCAHAGTPLSMTAPAEAIRLVRHLRDTYHARHFIFFNTNCNPTYDYVNKFLDTILEERLDILWQDSFNLRHMDADLAEKMAAAGVIRAVVGVEYPTARMLRFIRKGLDLDTLQRNLEHLHRAGIWVHALLIPGLPSETDKDLDELVAWVRGTKDYVNSYNISPFYMVSGSPFWRHPGRYGLELLGDTEKLQGSVAFREVGGAGWEEKKGRIAASAEALRRAIVKFKGHRKYAASSLDLHLLMYLYRVFGHARKDDVVRVYEKAHAEHPHVARAFPYIQQALASIFGSAPARRGRGASLARPPTHDGQEISFVVKLRECQTRYRLQPRDQFSYLKGHFQHEARCEGRLFTLSWSSGISPSGLGLASRTAEHPLIRAWIAARGWRLVPIERPDRPDHPEFELIRGTPEVRLEMAVDTVAGTVEIAEVTVEEPPPSAAAASPGPLRELIALLTAVAQRLSSAEAFSARLSNRVLEFAELWATQGKAKRWPTVPTPH